MFKNYIKIAFRNLWKDRKFTALNILGLSVAFGVAILLSMYALFELSYDQFHTQKDSLYQVYTTDETPDGPEASTSKSIPFAGALKAEVPGVEEITRYNGKGVLVLNGEKELSMSIAYVDPDFFSMFSFPVIEGKKQDPIADKSAVSLTQYAAKKIFGDQNAVGKSIRVLSDGEEKLYTVSSILEDMPEQSSIKFDLAVDFTNQSDFAYADYLNDWTKENHEVYMKLASGIDPAQFEKATKPFVQLHYKQEMADAKRDGAQLNAQGTYKQVRLLPITDVYLARFNGGLAQANKTMPYLVLGISLLILFIASVNFINMSIAKSAQRLREIGMRKTLGAAKGQLFFQFWGESILVFFISAGIGILLALLLLDPFKTLFATTASLDTLTHWPVLLAFSFGLILITLIAGGYPALLLSKLGTLQALKGKINVSRKNSVRDLLMVIQFGIAILLICGTLVLRSQIEFMRSKNLGFNKEQVISLPLNGKRPDAQAIQLLRNQLRDKKGILEITAANNILGLGKDGSRMTNSMGFDYKGRGVSTNILMVDYDYPETLDLKLAQGRSFNRQYAADSLAVLINESMARQLQEKHPLSAHLMIDDSISYSIIGVLKDYNFQELNKAIEPLTLFLKPNWNMRYAYLKVAPQHAGQSFEDIKTAWKNIEPNAEFMGSFLDENIDRTFKRERTMSTMITSGSIIAILLSCIGLFAISLLVVEQRRKEIGIRKVVGASVSTITVMLTVDFLKIVAISFLIAAPIAWWLTGKWLQDYANRIDLNIWIFILAGILVALIAILTISLRTIKAAVQNPIKSLRTE